MDFFSYWQKLDAEQRQALADASETKVVYLSQVAYGHRQVSQKLALNIERATGGAVTRHDLRPDLNPVESEGARNRRAGEAAA